MIVPVSQDGYVKRTLLTVKKVRIGSHGTTMNATWFRILKEPEGDNDLVLLTNLVGIISFPLNELRPMGELAHGVRAIKLQDFESIQDTIIIGSAEQ